ncbi:hypothetical protein [Nitrospina watsonii]|uniref:Uncharacterized protein n=1 Tax=Nitrospina watsonii TaxID=1323948 RepID=A0ABM9HHJ8_9BACT|nr:hypothetical protein [Nitrospina watsonii]CAI2719742.1 conserved protein of unknown function [Nitrospina watsonii]
MNSAFYFPTQAAPTAQWTPAKAPRFPVKRTGRYPGQTLGETAGGTVHVQDTGTFREHWELVFDRITPADHSALKTFFQTVQQAFNAFEFVDATGGVHTVRWINDFEFEETVPDRFSGTITLRKE